MALVLALCSAAASFLAVPSGPSIRRASVAAEHWSPLRHEALSIVMAATRDATLLEKLGGEPALEAAVNGFYDRLLEDPSLQAFFDDVDMSLLRWHQLNFMRIAFTGVPEGVDVLKLIKTKHDRLFDMGLNEGHFDIVAGHFVAQLSDMSVPPSLIDECVAVVGPLRNVFVETAAEKAAAKADSIPA